MGYGEHDHIDVRKDSEGNWKACVVRWGGRLVDFRPSEVNKFMERGDE